MIPAMYRGHLGLPLRWQDETSGTLSNAVHALVNYWSTNNNDLKPTPAQIELIRQYFEHYINAPCWCTDGMEAKFADLRSSVTSIKTVEELSVWSEQCLDVGLDPL